MPEMGRRVGYKLCEAWGLDPNKVQRIVVTIDASEVAHAEVTIYTDGEVTEQLLRLKLDPDHSDGTMSDG